MASLQQTELQFASDHVRILDALYGILKPLDAIKPYRLEMSNKLTTTRGSNMYTFWGKSLTDSLNRKLAVLWQLAKQLPCCLLISLQFVTES